MSRYRRSLWRVFCAPLLIGVVSLAGLILALLEDDATEIAAGLAVFVPVATIIWILGRRR